MQEQQELMLEERDRNLVLLSQDFRGKFLIMLIMSTDSLPRNLNSKLERIQKFIN